MLCQDGRIGGGTQDVLGAFGNHGDSRRVDVQMGRKVAPGEGRHGYQRRALGQATMQDAVPQAKRQAVGFGGGEHPGVMHDHDLAALPQWPGVAKVQQQARPRGTRQIPLLPSMARLAPGGLKAEAGERRVGRAGRGQQHRVLRLPVRQSAEGTRDLGGEALHPGQ